MTVDNFDFRHYASLTLNDGIYRIIQQHGGSRKPDLGLIVHELNKVSESLDIGVRFQGDDDGGVVIGIESDHDALRCLDILFVFSAVYPTLLTNNGDGL